jgi:LuxR family maltose regulon positive regulatory protein
VLNACAFQLSGDVSEINESLLRTAATAHVPSDLMTRFYAIVSLAELQRRQGRLRLAAATYREAMELAPAASGMQALINNGAAFYFGLGELRREQNDLDAAHDLLREGREMVLAGLLAEAEPITVGYTALSQLHLIRGDSSRALATLAELHEVARQRSFAPHLLARAESARAHLALLQEDLQTAVHWADTGTLRPDDDLSYPREVEYLTLARVRVAQGRTNPSTPNLLQTLNLLDRLLASAEAGARTDSVIKILILRALAFQVLGDPAAALATLEHALLLAAPEGYVRSFVDEGPPMAALLAEGLGQPAWGRGDGKQRHDVRTYANKLADVLRAEGVDLRADVYGPGASVQSVIAGVEPLTERELEVLRLLAAGRSNQGIAAELIVAVGTVKRHVSNIMDKLQAESRLEAVARARALGLL